MIALWTVLKNNDTLSHFDISNNMSHSSSLTQSVASDVMMHLSRALTGNISLKYLNLSKMGITDWSTCDFFATALESCSGLEHLDLSWFAAFRRYKCLTD